MPESSDRSSLQRGHIRYFPVVPGKLEFSAAVRHAILREQPKNVAVELPMSLENHYLRAIRRLPQISVILYDGDGDDQMIYVPVEPADPFTEAVRTALEIGASVTFLEPDLAPKPHLAERSPDTYAVRALGYEEFVELYRKQQKRISDEQRAHAAAIAWKLQGADPTGSTMAVLSLNLLEAVMEAVEIPQEDPYVGRPKRDVQVVNAHPNSLTEILIEYP
ncbi:MAG TPA: hypothetical protein VEQ63_09705, partial [Bryobacteraceae bacterium]|nr:hypothetical protein [Bryobacteraceae bacterium]